MARKGGGLGKKAAKAFKGLQKKGKGGGMGQEGIGQGGEAEENPNQKMAFDKTKLKGQFRKGEILGSLFTKGAPMKGEAKKEFTQAMSAEIQESTDALTKEDIPAGYKKLVKEYFDSVEKKAVNELGGGGGKGGGAAESGEGK